MEDNTKLTVKSSADIREINTKSEKEIHKVTAKSNADIREIKSKPEKEILKVTAKTNTARTFVELKSSPRRKFSR